MFPARPSAGCDKFFTPQSKHAHTIKSNSVNKIIKKCQHFNVGSVGLLKKLLTSVSKTYRCTSHGHHVVDH